MRKHIIQLRKAHISVVQQHPVQAAREAGGSFGTGSPDATQVQSHHRHGRGPGVCVVQQLLHERLGWATLRACCLPAQHIHNFGQQQRILDCVYVWFVFGVCMYVIA